MCRTYSSKHQHCHLLQLLTWCPLVIVLCLLDPLRI
jgi:hypothetical protein